MINLIKLVILASTFILQSCFFSVSDSSLCERDSFSKRTLKSFVDQYFQNKDTLPKLIEFRDAGDLVVLSDTKGNWTGYSVDKQSNLEVEIKVCKDEQAQVDIFELKYQDQQGQSHYLFWVIDPESNKNPGLYGVNELNFLTHDMDSKFNNSNFLTIEEIIKNHPEAQFSNENLYLNGEINNDGLHFHKLSNSHNLVFSIYNEILRVNIKKEATEYRVHFTF